MDDTPDQPREFGPPWHIEECSDSGFKITASSGHLMAFVYYGDQIGANTWSNLSKVEAENVAKAIARIPEVDQSQERYLSLMHPSVRKIIGGLNRDD